MDGRTSGRSTEPSLDATSTFRRSLGTNVRKNRFSSWLGTSTAAVLRKARRLSSTGVASAANPSPSGGVRAVFVCRLVPPRDAVRWTTDEHGLLERNSLALDPDTGLDPQARFGPGDVNGDIGSPRDEGDRL